MASHDPSSDVEDQAAVWASRSAFGTLTEEDRAELDAWLASDPRHAGAYLRARAAVIVMEDAVVRGRPVLASDNDNAAAVDGASSPREGLWGSFKLWGGIAACAAGLAAVVVPTMRRPEQAAAVRHETMALADGSTVTLEEGAHISVAMTSGSRRILLERGKATFHVAKDRARPFIVRSGDVYAQATGTVYSVRRLGPVGGTVSVTEGSVLVWAGEERERAVLLRAGGTLSLDPGRAVKAVAKPHSVSAAAPETAQLSFDDVPIAAAVARFNRAQKTREIVVDPGLGEVTVVGLFRADDPEQFARAVAAVSGGQIERRGNRILIRQR